MKETVNVKYMGIFLTLEGYYEKGDEQVRYYPDGSGYDGYPSEFETYSVYVNGVDIINMLLDSQLEDLDALAIGEIEG